MERNRIRGRWQITIPPGIRQGLKMFEGQTLNWQIIDWEGQTVLMVFCGDFAQRGEDPGFIEEIRRIRKRGRKKRLTFGISDAVMAPRGREKLRAIILDVLGEFLGGRDMLKESISGDPDGSGTPPQAH